MQCDICGEGTAWRLSRSCSVTWCMKRICFDCCKAAYEICKSCMKEFDDSTSNSVCSECKAPVSPDLPRDEVQCPKCKRPWCGVHFGSEHCPVCLVDESDKEDRGFELTK